MLIVKQLLRPKHLVIGKNVKVYCLFNTTFMKQLWNLLVSSEYLPPHPTDFFLVEGIFNQCVHVFAREGGVKHKRITCGILGDTQGKSVNQVSGYLKRIIRRFFCQPYWMFLIALFHCWFLSYHWHFSLHFLNN